MTKTQKLDRLKKNGWTVSEYPFLTLRFEAFNGKEVYEARNIYNLFKQIFGY